MVETPLRAARTILGKVESMLGLDRPGLASRMRFASVAVLEGWLVSLLGRDMNTLSPAARRRLEIALANRLAGAIRRTKGEPAKLVVAIALETALRVKPVFKPKAIRAIDLKAEVRRAVQGKKGLPSLVGKARPSRIVTVDMALPPLRREIEVKGLETLSYSVPSTSGVEVSLSLSNSDAGFQFAEVTVVPVFFATDRDDAGSPLPAQRFGRKRADGLTYGIAEVTIPPGHRLGELESPSLWRFEFRADPQKHVILRDIQTKAEGAFFDDLRAAVAKSKEKQSFVFVHGYNVTFEDAARRTGQLAFDLGFDGAPILYSWPSQGTVPGYPVDRENATWSIPHLEAFLAKVARDTGAERIHVIAHSMGNQVLAGALDRLAAAAPPPLFNEIVLTAPDIDAQVFQNLAARILPAAQRTTLYASAADKALAASYEFNGHRRAGDTRDGVVVIPGMDTVDATRVDTSFLGHSYIGDEESVLSDLFYLIKGLACAQRHRLRPAAWQGQPYWEFKP